MHFTVSQAVQPRRVTKRRIYKLVDYNEEDVKIYWYPEELKEIRNNQYRVKKVMGRRTLPDGTKELVVQ